MIGKQIKAPPIPKPWIPLIQLLDLDELIPEWINHYRQNHFKQFTAIDGRVNDTVAALVKKIKDFSIDRADTDEWRVAWATYLSDIQGTYDIMRSRVITSNDFLTKVIIENGRILEFQLIAIGQLEEEAARKNLFNDLLATLTKKGADAATIETISGMISAYEGKIYYWHKSQPNPIIALCDSIYWLECCHRADQLLASEYGAKTLLEKRVTTMVSNWRKMGRGAQKRLNDTIYQENKIRIRQPIPGDVEQLADEVRTRATYSSFGMLPAKITQIAIAGTEIDREVDRLKQGQA